jgi:hypothetical protein
MASVKVAYYCMNNAGKIRGLFILYAFNILYLLYEILFNIQPYLLARYIERQLILISSQRSAITAAHCALF